MNTGRKTILLFDTGKEWGGGTNSMIELLKRIDRKRFSVVCCFYTDYRRGANGPLLSEELARIGIPLVVLRPPRQPLWVKITKELVRGLLRSWPVWRRQAIFRIDKRWRIMPMAERLAELLRIGRFDQLYMNNQPSSNLEGYLAADLAGLPVVQHCRIETSLNPTEVALTNHSARRIICVSQGVAQSLRDQGVYDHLLVVVPNGIDIHQALPSPQRSEWMSASQLIVGTVGQLVSRKSVADLLDAIALIRDDGGPRMDLLIVGEGPEAANLRALASRLGVSEQTHFVGFQREPLPWIAAMDIFVLASHREGLPRVILEAMLLAKPVIAARAVGSSEVVADKVTGLLYPHGDVRSLADAIMQLYRKPALRAQMGAAGRERVSQMYSIEQYVEGVQNCLWEAACSRSS
jgi:glycosyltransferase involved in cell wall biosynthesis